MSILTKATSAAPVKNAVAQNIIYIYAAILVIFLLAQLFSYEDFVLLIQSFWLPGGEVMAKIISFSIVACELFALPFLLRMKMSPLMRIVSMVMGWFVPLIWLFLTLWVNLTVNAISNIGFLGSVIKLTPGWWSVGVVMVIGALSDFSTYNLWPLSKKTRKNK